MDNTSFIIQQLINAIFLGSIFSLIALGYTMVYGIIELINFAHGELFTAGAFIGPTVGVTLSTLAAYLVEVGVAQTLLSLMPIFIIPVVWILYRQRTSWRGIIGACIAVAGVALLFMHQYL